MEQLRDIKDIVTVEDHSLWLLIALLLLAAAAAGVWYRYGRRRGVRRRFRKSARELAAERIAHIDYDDPKSVAYTFTEDVGRFVDEARRGEYEEIVRQLEPYKYRREVPALPPQLRTRIEKFIKERRWSN